MTRVLPGRPYPLGASADPGGAGFALWSGAAEAVELCLFDEDGQGMETRLILPECSGGVWHGYVPGVRPGQLYGYRVHGPRRPDRGLRFNPYKLLLDPWAKAIRGEILPHPACFDLGAEPDRNDSAPHMPRCVVVDDAFDWGEDRAPAVPWHDTLIYECHVRAVSARHPEVSEQERGRYLGLASPPMIEHLKSLGVTAVQLLPVQHFAHEPHLVRRGMRNAWGYNPVGFMAPYAGYASGAAGEQVTEFKTMVRRLHAEGIEVLLDVVFNHSGEADERGPVYSLKGIDNRAYYRLPPENAARYSNWTGCGNTLDIRNPGTLRMVLDSMRYWVREMHVDGFRFDLAAVLGRAPGDGFNAASTFFRTVEQDPVLQGVKLIAESWDLGPDGYKLGGFPWGWAEWNDQYRDGVRRFFCGLDRNVAELATRLSGSSDIFPEERGPTASINYLACHDGFTLADLTSYTVKRNQGNGENNGDGRNDEPSCNGGAEGPTDDPEVLRIRDRTRRSLIAALAVSQGVPMLLHGDELGRSKEGNNNSYCREELNVLRWDLDEHGRSFLEFVRAALRLRRENPVLRRRAYFHGRPVHCDDKDITWLDPEGRELHGKAWRSARGLGMLIHGHSADWVDEEGRSVDGASLLVLVNADDRPLRFKLPAAVGVWHVALRSSGAEVASPVGADCRAQPGEVVILILENEP